MYVPTNNSAVQNLLQRSRILEHRHHSPERQVRILSIVQRIAQLRMLPFWLPSAPLPLDGAASFEGGLRVFSFVRMPDPRPT